MTKFLLELAPLLIFFGVYKFYGLMAATIALMITTPISLIIYWFVYRKVATMPLVTAVLVLVAIHLIGNQLPLQLLMLSTARITRTVLAHIPQ